MAINRFMQPWKRDFSTAHYIPNYDAWAKVLEQKEKNFDDLLANADKLSTLVPEAGYALTDDRNAYMDQIRQKTSGLIDNLRETGNMTDTRREISKLANEITTSPRLSAYKSDFALKPEVAKTIMSQTAETDVFKGSWYNPETKQITQTTWDKWNPSYYSTVATKDANAYFYDLAKPLKPLFESQKKLGNEFTIQEIIDPETGRKSFKYLLMGTNTSFEGKTAEHLFNYLHPGGKYGQYAEQVYKNARDDRRAYWDAIQKEQGLSEAETREMFFKDLLGAAAVDIYVKKTEESFIADEYNPATSSTGSENPEAPTQPKIIGSTVGIGVQYENLSSAGQLVTRSIQVEKDIHSLNQNKVDKANEKLSSIFGGQNVITRDSSGRLTLNSQFTQDLNQDQLNSIYGQSLDMLGTTVHDFIAKTNDIHKSLVQEKEVLEEVFAETGLDDLSQQQIVQDLRHKAMVNATARAGVEGKTVEHKGQGRKKATEQEIEAEFNRLVASSDHAKLKELQQKIEARKSKVYAIDASTYLPLTATAKDEKMVDGMATAIMQLTKNANLQIKIPGQDKFLTGEQRDRANEALNGYFKSAGKEKYFQDFSTNFQLFFDPEEAAYKMLIAFDNGNLAEEMGQKGQALLEVPFGNSFISADGKSVTIPEYLGIESDQEVIGSMQQIEQDFKKGMYTSFQSGSNEEKYMIKANILTSDPNARNITTTFRVTFDDGKRWQTEVNNPREAAVLKKVVSELSTMPFESFSTQTAIDYIRSPQMSKQLPTLSSLTDEQLAANVNQWIGKGVGKLNSDSEFYSIDPKITSPYIDKSLFKGLESMAAHIFSNTNQRIKVNETHDPNRKNKKSQHVSGNAFDISYSEIIEKELSEMVVLNEGETFKKGGTYYLKPEFGGHQIIYETPETHGNNPDFTATHFHISKVTKRK